MRSCLLSPFMFVWRLVSAIVELTGRLIAVVLGAVLMIVGVIATVTIVGAIIGVPVFLTGLLLVFRGLF